MYLKNIEVQGFKSFANKIVFDFHNGITGIVGPNGSGKSNVADAVRWVLGEQRVKQLRGGNMQDVIFSGTENRKPLSYASVAITLDNSDHQLPVDYEEVKVTRKLYRSGESEYLLNGSSCRLKDINEMFYDTGIGKEGYSIIGQGQIDKILSGKPEERRELFDEAAGIVKFKRRKNMSLKKLEEEQQNLLRVTDILSELEKQFGPLQKQSETAKIFLKKKEELKRFDINMFLLETARLKTLIQEMDEKILIAKSELSEAQAKHVDMKEEYELVEEEMDQIDADVEYFNQQLNKSTLLKQQLENQIELLKEQINSAKNSDEHYRSRKEIITEELKRRKEQIEGAEKEKEEIVRELEIEKGKQSKEQNQLFEIQGVIAELTVEIDNLQNEIREILNNRASTKAKIQHYNTSLDQIVIRRENLYKRIKEFEEKIQNEQLLYEECKKEYANSTEKISHYQEEIQTLEKNIEKQQKLISEKNDRLRVSQGAYHREQSRLDSLKNMTERYEGYGNSIRKIMECKVNTPGLHGVVADLIQAEKKYEIAIETALGGSIQNVVTADEDTAKKMIQYLKTNKYGRATFLPLTSIRGGVLQNKGEVLKEKGVIGTADSLVHVDPKYKILSEHLLGRTVVVDQIDTGIRIARAYRQSLRIVTLEGELINPGGAMSGGAFKNSSNLLSRRREMDELEKKVIQLQKEMQGLQSDVLIFKEKRTALYAELENLQQELQKEYVIQNTAKMKLDQIESRKSIANDTISEDQLECEKLTSELDQIKENQESIALELETSEQIEAELTRKINEKQSELDEKRILEGETVHRNETINLSYASLEQKYDFLSENLKRIIQEQNRFQEELEDLETNKGVNADEITEKESQIQDIKETILDSDELFDELKQEIQAAKEKKEALSKKNRDFLQKRDDLSNHILELEKEQLRLNSKKETYEESYEKEVDYMWEEYEITYNHALGLKDESLVNLSDIKKNIHEIKQEIKGLGSVNVNAIEDFKNLQERYEFMKTQHDDLVEAEQTLMKIIEELDQAMRKQFSEQFGRISEEFNQVFKELFGGGKGTLELMEEEDILEAGIRIIAQPPGKKLQNMMQLSGGEKALTAIALLFAIQNLKPSPFCLLDEIEAALDDSNVTRFAQYLHKLTKSTQFIVITHRRGTMTAADRLYGITMQEKGISTLVSVDLLEDELEKEKVNQ